jgi:hypothetical protein
MYLMGSVHHLTSEFSQIAERTLSPIVSRALLLSLLLLFNFVRLLAFTCLRPFDFMMSRESTSYEGTLDETHAIGEYRKVLNDTLPSIGLDN